MWLDMCTYIHAHSFGVVLVSLPPLCSVLCAWNRLSLMTSAFTLVHVATRWVCMCVCVHVWVRACVSACVQALLCGHHSSRVVIEHKQWMCTAQEMLQLRADTHDRCLCTTVHVC